MQNSIKIRFENVSVAEAGKLATGLRGDLNDIGDDIDATVVQENPNNQDFGTTLVLVLGTPAVVAVAKGISNYLNRAGAKITIESDGKVIATNISGGDLAEIQKAIKQH